MHIDGLTTILILSDQMAISAITARLFTAVHELEAEVDFSRVPSAITNVFQAALDRCAKRQLLDSVVPLLLHKACVPAATHLSSRLSWPGLETEETHLYYLEAVRKLELPIVVTSQCWFTVVIHASMAPVLPGRGIEIVFDWRPLNKASDPENSTKRIITTLTRHLQPLSGAIGSLTEWRDCFVNKQLKDVLSQPLDAGYPSDIASLEQDSSKEISVSERNEVQSHPFAALWSGASGRFSGTNEGQENAEFHYRKHCLLQAEWSKGTFLSSKDYVALAASCLDSLSAYEMRQPSNRAVIKYDEESDVLAIGGMNDGHLYTCFRPGGYSYVLRKLESGQWLPPPVDDLVDYQQILPEKVDGLIALMTEWSGRIDEAQAETTACVLELTETNRSSRLLTAIAYQSRLEFLLRGLRRRYLDGADEAKIDGFELHLNELRAFLELLFEKMDSTTPKLISEACRNGVETLSRQVEESFCGQEQELLEDVLNLRDNLEFAKMALRSHSWICSFADLEELKLIWGELAKGDILLKLNQPQKIRSSSVNDFPETFFWRF